MAALSPSIPARRYGPQPPAPMLCMHLFRALMDTKAQGNTRHVLVAMLALSNREREVCSSAPAIAWMAGLPSTETTRRAIRELIALGEVELVSRGRGHQVNVYRVKVGDWATA